MPEQEFWPASLSDVCSSNQGLQFDDLPQLQSGESLLLEFFETPKLALRLAIHLTLQLLIIISSVGWLHRVSTFVVSLLFKHTIAKVHVLIRSCIAVLLKTDKVIILSVVDSVKLILGVVAV